MIKYAVIYSLLLSIFASCDKVDSCEKGNDLPHCIQETINKDSSSYAPILSVQRQKIDGDYHYWLNTDARHYDGSEAIVNTSCDTVCWFCGFCVQPACIEKYATTWDTIWTK